MRRLRYPVNERFAEAWAHQVGVGIGAFGLLAAAVFAFNGSDKSSVPALATSGSTLAGAIVAAFLGLSSPGRSRLILSLVGFLFSAVASILFWGVVGEASQILLAVPPLVLLAPLVVDLILTLQQRSLHRRTVRRLLRRRDRRNLDGTAITLARGMTGTEVRNLQERLNLSLPAPVLAIYTWRNGQRPNSSPGAWRKGRFPGLSEGLSAGERELKAYKSRTGESLRGETWIVLADAKPFYFVLRLSVLRLKAPGLVLIDGQTSLENATTESLSDFLREWQISAQDEGL